jgi:predicted transcriptional regulator
MIVLNTNRKTAKTAIIDHLSKEFPLTTKKIHHTLQREYGIDVSYQAVHKALQELEKEKVLSKSKEGWQLDGEWLQNQEKFIQGTKQKYSGNKNRYDINLHSDKPQVFHFDNHTDFSVETAKLVANKILCKTNEPAYFLLEFGWWTLKFKFEHLFLLYSIVKSAPKSVHLIQKITPFGRWMQKQYERVGGIGTIGINMNLSDDFLIQEDWIIQVHFSDHDKKIIEKYWKKWNDLEDCYLEFGLKEEPRMAITVTISKNSGLAKYLVGEVLKLI